MVFVTDIPMLAGAPAETSLTIIDVEIEEDWTRTVTSTPIITPTTGFFNISELENKAPIVFPTKNTEGVWEEWERKNEELEAGEEWDHDNYIGEGGKSTEC